MVGHYSPAGSTRPTLSNEKVLVRAKPHPSRKALRIMAVEVVGGAEARPKGLGNLRPAISTLMSTASMAQWKRGSVGTPGMSSPWRDYRDRRYQVTQRD